MKSVVTYVQILMCYSTSIQTNVSQLQNERALRDFRYLQISNSEEKSPGINNLGLSAGPRFDSGRKPRHFKSIWICAITPSSNCSKLLFPVIKAPKTKKSVIKVTNWIPRHFFLICGLLCRHTANLITSQTHTCALESKNCLGMHK